MESNTSIQRFDTFALTHHPSYHPNLAGLSLKMSSNCFVHVVAKENIANHTVVPHSSTFLPQLQDGHVRVRVIIVSLTVNTQAYARMGTVRAWWDAYPVPDSLSEPYNDQSRYGICPAWGYAEVMDSKVSGITTGELIWGMLPTSSLPVDLKLTATIPNGHWIEDSEHRKTLMNLYQRYIIPDPKARVVSLRSTEWNLMAMEAIMLVRLSGYMINANVFGRDPIHPLGFGEWTKKDADLSSAVVIALSGSGKTSRAFIHGLTTDRESDQGPLGLLSITSLANFDPKASFTTKSVSYEQSTSKETMDWVSDRKPTKIVVVDFGGRGNSLYDLLDALETINCEVVVIGVGGSADMNTPGEVGEWAEKTMSLKNRVQMNTSGIRDTAIEKYGAEAHFKDVERTWQSFLQSPLMSDLKVEIGEGVAGENGFEGGWTKPIDGKVPGNIAMAFRF